MSCLIKAKLKLELEDDEYTLETIYQTPTNILDVSLRTYLVIQKTDLDEGNIKAQTCKKKNLL